MLQAVLGNGLQFVIGGFLPFVINTSLKFLVLHTTLSLQFQSSIGSSFDVAYPHRCFPEYEFGTFEVVFL